MKFLVAFALLMFSMSSQPALPREFNQIDEKHRQAATVIFTGIYQEDKSPHIPRGQSQMVRYLLFGFQIEQVYRGEVKADYVGIAGKQLPTRIFAKQALIKGQRYLVLLKPQEDSLKILQTGEGNHYYFNRLDDDEILAVKEVENSK
jgi:hypothetical protein